MSDSYLPPAEITRRQIIRKVASRARVHGWQWAGNHDGWWTPNGELVTVDQLFRAPSPASFLEPLPVQIEGRFVVLPLDETRQGEGS